MKTDNKKIFNRVKKRVLKKFPTAKTQVTNEGTYYVSDGMGGRIGEDFMIPAQKSVIEAWAWAAESVKLQQNLNRTHPMKYDMEIDEKKFNRVSRRNRKK
jgi:hypothetical protein